MKTLEELERMAYINGHTDITDLLAQMIDTEVEVEQLNAEVEQLIEQLETK